MTIKEIKQLSGYPEAPSQKKRMIDYPLKVQHCNSIDIDYCRPSSRKQTRFILLRLCCNTT